MPRKVGTLVLLLLLMSALIVAQPYQVLRTDGSTQVLTYDQMTFWENQITQSMGDLQLESIENLFQTISERPDVRPSTKLRILDFVHKHSGAVHELDKALTQVSINRNVAVRTLLGAIEQLSNVVYKVDGNDQYYFEQAKARLELTMTLFEQCLSDSQSVLQKLKTLSTNFGQDVVEEKNRVIDLSKETTIQQWARWAKNQIIVEDEGMISPTHHKCTTVILVFANTLN